MNITTSPTVAQVTSGSLIGPISRQNHQTKFSITSCLWVVHVQHDVIPMMLTADCMQATNVRVLEQPLEAVATSMTKTCHQQKACFACHKTE